MNGIKRLASLVALSTLVSCAGSEVQKQPSPTTAPIQRQNELPTENNSANVESAKKSNYNIDPASAEKSKPLFEAIVKNDEKKAKQAYGRAVHVLPEIVQLAVDLRLKNYDHAAGVLPKTHLLGDQQDFWSGIIKDRPKKLEASVCEALMANPAFPSAGEKVPEEEAGWLRYFDEVAQKVVNPNGMPKEHSEITKSMERVICTERECGPIQDNLRDDILTDKFFDNLHNMRRRDTRFFKANFKSPLKIWQYQPYVSDMALLKFYRALKNTHYDKQNHFIRRFKGIARDMRAETILSRSIADIILGDDQDLALAKRLGSFLTSNSLISAVTRIEGELPSCHAPMVPASASPSAPAETPALQPTPTPSN